MVSSPRNLTLEKVPVPKLPMVIALFQKSKEVIMALKHCDELGMVSKPLILSLGGRGSLITVSLRDMARPTQSDLVKK